MVHACMMDRSIFRLEAGSKLRLYLRYSGSYISTMTVEELKRWHLPRIRLLVEASVDLLAVETIPSKVEAMAVLSVLNREFPHIPAYV